MIETHRWRGGAESMLRHGQGLPVTLVFLPALFEEANRLRRFTIAIMRLLADHGIGSLLPDFPGSGESMRTLAETSLADWREFALSLAAKTPFSAALRGGGLLDSPFEYRWRLAPLTGDAVLRDIVRATAIGENRPVGEIEAMAASRPMRLAGQHVSPEFVRDLSETKPQGSAFLSEVPGPKLWRNAEPGYDEGYAAALANEIAQWISSCDAT